MISGPEGTLKLDIALPDAQPRIKLATGTCTGTPNLRINWSLSNNWSMGFSQKDRIRQRVALGERRIINILRSHGVATMRMLEQKISDAGPSPQRIDPHLLTQARINLAARGTLGTRISRGIQWHHLSASDPIFVEQRFADLDALHARTEQRSFTDRIGDTAEIAVLKSMQRSHMNFFGHFTDLDKHGDDERYTKHDPDFFSGLPIQGGKLDFILVHPEAGGLGIEVKNIREWVYPDKDIVKDLLRKCIQVDVIPVLVARRIHYSTFTILNACGGIIHQIYNQLYPLADAELAEEVRDKTKLGYSDVRVGNEPDARLLKFFGSSLNSIAPSSRNTFNRNKAAIADYVLGSINYAQFVAVLRGTFEE
jgi:hypothetical protein